MDSRDIEATTERTCETQDDIKDCKGCRFEDMTEDHNPCHRCTRSHMINYEYYGDLYKTRPAAQDADQLRREFEDRMRPCCSLTRDDERPDEYLYEDVQAMWQGWRMARDGWNRRPSLPMSAEVEKAVDGRPTREEYAKWVAFYFSAVDDEEARSAGCARDGHDMLRGLYEREVAALKEKQIDRIIECPSCGSRWNISRYNACACGAVLALKEKV